MFRYFKIGYYFVKENFYYRQSILGRSILLILLCIIITTLIGIGVNFNTNSNIGGISFKYYIWYIWVGELIVLSALSYNWFEEILSGNILTYLTKPLNFLYFFWGKIIGGKITMIFILAFFSFPIILVLNHFNILIQNFFLLIFILPFVLFLSTLIDTVVVLISFWLEKALFIRLVTNKMYLIFGGLFLPISIYPQWVQNLSLWLPFAYTINLPAKIFVSENLSFLVENLILIKLIIWISILTMLNLILYKVMIKKLEINGG